MPESDFPLIFQNQNMEKIENIYVFCDRWCERCAFGARCNAYAAREEIRKPENLMTDDEKNKLFWEDVESKLIDVISEIKEKASAGGIDLSVFEGVSTKAKFDLFQRKAVNNMVLKAGRLYEDKVDDFLDDSAEAGRIAMDELQSGSIFKITDTSLPKTEKQVANDMISIIMRYQLLLYLKLSRAYYSKGRELEDASVPNTSGESIGTAKVALSLISRSMVAWQRLAKYFPEQAAEIDDILFLLMRMKNHLESEFPLAIAFVRPGFDE